MSSTVTTATVSTVTAAITIEGLGQVFTLTALVLPAIARTMPLAPASLTEGSLFDPAHLSSYWSLRRRRKQAASVADAGADEVWPAAETSDGVAHVAAISVSMSPIPDLRVDEAADGR